ncbi:MAG: lysophospholipase [Oscillospiraceae bacterium]|nr:lysophospholipase [Oscillospiraceae bacterium]
MSFNKEFGYFESTNGADRIAYYVYTPKDREIRGTLQIVHGMCEYCARYEDFISYLCENGIMVCCHDQLGHGSSVSDKSKLGYFAPERGWHFLAKDAAKLTKTIKDKHPECRKLPYFILGHSMGSLVVRTALTRYGFMYDGAIILGTLNTSVGADGGIVLTSTLCRVKGGTNRSPFIDRLVFGVANKRIENPVSEYSWLSRDDEVVLAYERDPLCNFHFTLRGYYDLMFLISYVAAKDWAGKIDKDLPMFICSGSEDPIGSYGEDPKEVFDALNDAGATDIELKIYSGARHELLNETNKEEVYADLLEWLNNHMAILTE